MKVERITASKSLYIIMSMDLRTDLDDVFLY